MARKGFKVADAYVELTTDRSSIGQAIRGLPAEFGGDATRAGKAIGEKLTDGLRREVESLSRKIAAARRTEETAADALRLAELKLNEARAKSNVQASTLLALENKVAAANRKLASARDTVTTATSRQADAERRLAAAIAEGLDSAEAAAAAGGERVGDKMTLGISAAIRRKKPIIVAALTAGLLAGAPALLGAATTLFAGIGIAAAAQNERVKAAWSGMWADVKAGAASDSQVLVSTLVGAADQIGAGFQRMRPLLRDAFAAVGPQINVFTDSLVRAAQLALPGLVTAVQRGMPVVQGFGSMMQSFGAGLGEMFVRMSANSGAAGETFAALGRIIGALLPILGSLMGAGAQLASVILPPIASILEVVASALGAVQPLLAPIAAGFLAFRAASAAAGYLQTFAVQAQFATMAMTGSAAAGTRVGAAMAGLARGLPLIGAAVAVVATAFAAGRQKTDEFAQAMLQGGNASAQALQQMANPSLWDKFLFNLTHWGNTEQVATRQTREATAAMRESLAAMDPVSRTKALLVQASNDLSAALEGEGRFADDVAGAQENYARASAAAERAQSDLETAINGVSGAMVEQTELALAAIDADFAHQRAVDALEDSARALAEATRDYGAGSEQASDATREFGEGILAAAEAAGRMAHEALPAGTDALTRQRAAQEATLGELYRLRDAYPQLAGSIDGMIAKVEASGLSFDGAGAKADAATQIMQILGQQRPNPIAALTDTASPTGEQAIAVLQILAAQKPTPIAKLLDGSTPTAQQAIAILQVLGGQRPEAIASLVDGATPTARQAMAVLDILGGKRPNPVASLTDNASRAAAFAQLEMDTLNGKRPNPVASLTDFATPGAHRASGVLHWLGGHHANPTATLHDNASGTAHYIQGAINNIRGRTIYVNTVWRNIREEADGGPVTAPFIRPAIKAAHGRRVVGPGGPTDDLVPAMGPGGTRFQLSNGEWIVKASAVAALERRFGSSAMHLINSGRLPSDGPPGAAASGAAPTGTPAAGASPRSGSPGRAPITLHVNFNGLGLGDRRAMREAALVLRDELRRVDRELA